MLYSTVLLQQLSSTPSLFSFIPGTLFLLYTPNGHMSATLSSSNPEFFSFSDVMKLNYPERQISFSSDRTNRLPQGIYCVELNVVDNNLE